MHIIIELDLGMAPSSQNAETKLEMRAADKLFCEFERMINAGELTDGEQLPPEREIVETFGVSRTVVREAILALSSKGLVEARPRFRPVVRKPTYDAAVETVGNVVLRLLEEPEGLKNLFDTRALMEATLVREAAKFAKRADLEAMKKALDANGAAIDDSEEFYKTDIQFHGVFFGISGNPALESLHKAYTSWLAAHWQKMPRMRERNLLNFEAHTAIYNAVLIRDPDEAEAAMREHMDFAWSQVSSTFKTVNPKEEL